jgi:hypothetical protein
VREKMGVGVVAEVRQQLWVVVGVVVMSRLQALEVEDW